MKVDVEGMEIDVFRGAIETIRRHKPLIHFEQTGERNLKHIWHFLRDFDYNLYWHVANPYTANNFNHNPHNIFGGTCEVNIIAVPPAHGELADQLGVADRRLDEPIFNPVIPDNAAKGWELPEDAYADLEPPESRKNAIALFGQDRLEYATLQQALSELQQRYDALVEDRKKAQNIMQHQHREILRLHQQK
jgi:hypothetical protein